MLTKVLRVVGIFYEFAFSFLVYLFVFDHVSICQVLFHAKLLVFDLFAERSLPEVLRLNKTLHQTDITVKLNLNQNTR